MTSSYSRTTTTIFKKYYSSYTGLSTAAWQGIFIGFIEATLMSICYFLAIYFVTELHLSIVDAGLILAFYGIGTIFGGMLGGKLSDLIQPRIVSIGSLILQALGFFLLMELKSTTLLMLNLFIIGIGAYGFITSNHVWTLSQCKQEERLKAINILDVTSNLGLALSGLIISCISTNHFNSLFFASGFLISVTTLALSISNKNKFTRPVIQVNTTQPSKASDKKIIYFVLLCLFLVGFIISQINSTYPIYLQSIFPAMGTRSFGILLTLNAILVVLFQGPFVNHLGKFNKILLIGSGAFLLGLGMFLLNVAYAFWIAIISCIITTMGEILFFSIAQLICYEKGAENKKGHSLGAYRTVYATSRVAGPALGSLIYQRINGQSLWAFCLLLGVFCFLSSYTLRNND